MSNFKNSPLILKVFKDFGIHLQIHLKNFAIHWVQTIEKHSSLIFAKIVGDFLTFKLFDDLLIFFKDRASNN